MEPILVSELVDDFRNRLGDSSHSIPVPYLISFINTALRRLARTDGLAPLFERHDVFELATINKDGTAAASWPLDMQGLIIDITKMRLLVTNDGKVRQVKPTYKDPAEFFDCVVLPEQNACGDPSIYTIEQTGVTSKLIFDRPTLNLMAVDMIYSVFHRRVKAETDALDIPYAYADTILEYIIIIHKIETTDMSTARALYEDLDLITTEIKELLATRKGALPLRRVARSF